MTGYVYAVECGGRIKIGFSKAPEKRFNKIASDAPFPCDLLGFWSGSKADELAIHERFRATRVHGEWFASTELILGFIAEISEPGSKDRAGKRYAPGERDSVLLSWRKSRKIPGPDIAEKIGVTKATWSRWERGKMRIPAERCRSISDVTGIPVEQIRPDLFPTKEPAK